MEPQRPGNENFPEGSVTPMVGQNVGLQYPPWQGFDEDDLNYPTVNVHYDHEVKDWVKKLEDAENEISRRREANRFLTNMERDKVSLQGVLSKQNQEMQELTDVFISQIMQSKDHGKGKGTAYKRIPDSIKTGSALDTGAKARIDRKINAKYQQKGAKNTNADSFDSFSGSKVRSFSSTPDVFMHLAEDFATE